MTGAFVNKWKKFSGFVRQKDAGLDVCAAWRYNEGGEGCDMADVVERRLRVDDAFPFLALVSGGGEKPIHVESHRHAYYELLYFTRGEAEQVVGDRRFHCGQGDIVIIDKDTAHETHCGVVNAAHVLVFQFRPEFLGLAWHQSLFELQHLAPFWNTRQNEFYHIPQEWPKAAELADICLRIFDEYTRAAAGYQLYCKAYLYEFIACLARGYAFYNDKARPDNPMLLPFFLYMETNVGVDLGMGEAARLCSMSYSHFSRIFKREMGVSFKAYMDVMRIQAAEELIMFKGNNVVEAAMQAGFANVSSFTRLYKRIRGFSPGTLKRTKTAKKKAK